MADNRSPMIKLGNERGARSGDREGSSGKRIYGLIGYLFGPGECNEHGNPHVVAGFRRPAALERAFRPDGSLARGRHVGGSSSGTGLRATAPADRTAANGRSGRSTNPRNAPGVARRRAYRPVTDRHGRPFHRRGRHVRRHGRRPADPRRGRTWTERSTANATHQSARMWAQGS